MDETFPARDLSIFPIKTSPIKLKGNKSKLNRYFKQEFKKNKTPEWNPRVEKQVLSNLLTGISKWLTLYIKIGAQLKGQQCFCQKIVIFRISSFFTYSFLLNRFINKFIQSKKVNPVPGEKMDPS